MMAFLHKHIYIYLIIEDVFLISSFRNYCTNESYISFETVNIQLLFLDMLTHSCTEIQAIQPLLCKYKLFSTIIIYESEIYYDRPTK